MYQLIGRHAMDEEVMADGKPKTPWSKGMSLYASSADYEKRLSEDYTLFEFEPDLATQALVEKA
jgi:hypothetical protein